jgi:hypothetical protein
LKAAAARQAGGTHQSKQRQQKGSQRQQKHTVSAAHAVQAGSEHKCQPTGKASTSTSNPCADGRIHEPEPFSEEERDQDMEEPNDQASPAPEANDPAPPPPAPEVIELISEVEEEETEDTAA